MKQICMALPNLAGNEEKYIIDCIRTGWISSAGEYVVRFERAFSQFCNVGHATSCSNGTAALHLALLAAGIKRQDEVIIPDLTFAATANTVIHCNAKPAMVDVDRKTWNIDPKKIKDRITKKTKAIIPVHLYGNPCAMDEIMEIADKHGLIVIEDCAEAIGARFRNKQVGSIGHIGCFSFYGNKIITTGEGGMCVSNDKELIEKINILKNHGMKKERRYWHEMPGYNYRLTNIQAAVGVAQLERIGEFIQKRDDIITAYRRLLALPGIQFQQAYPDAKPVGWMFSILVDETFHLTKDTLMKRLEKHNIESRPVFYPLSKMPPYKRYIKKEATENTEYVSRNGVSLPTHTSLSEEEINLIAAVVRSP